MASIIKHKFFFSHSPEMVWEYLTNPDLMELWLMKNNFRPIIGYDFQFSTHPEPSMDFDGTFYCKVLELIPFEKLLYSWKAGPGESKISLDSIVEWTLKRKAEGTELFLTHRGFQTGNLNIYNAMNSGWSKKFQIINDLLNNIEHGPTNFRCLSGNR